MVVLISEIFESIEFTGFILALCDVFAIAALFILRKTVKDASSGLYRVGSHYKRNSNRLNKIFSGAHLGSDNCRFTKRIFSGSTNKCKPGNEILNRCWIYDSGVRNLLGLDLQKSGS